MCCSWACARAEGTGASWPALSRSKPFGYPKIAWRWHLSSPGHVIMVGFERQRHRTLTHSHVQKHVLGEHERKQMGTD